MRTEWTDSGVRVTSTQSHTDLQARVKVQGRVPTHRYARPLIGGGGSSVQTVKLLYRVLLYNSTVRRRREDEG